LILINRYQKLLAEIELMSSIWRSRKFHRGSWGIPVWGGHGVASALLVRTMKEFIAAGMEHAALDVDTPTPTVLLKLYEALGFIAVMRTDFFMKVAD
jgi:hypothetical protein